MNATDIQVTVTRGDIGEAARDLARRRISHALRLAHVPMLHGRVALAIDPDPALECPARAAAALDVGGRLILARAAAATPGLAIDLLEDRLRSRLVRLTGRRVARRQVVGGQRPASRSHQGPVGSR